MIFSNILFVMTTSYIVIEFIVIKDTEGFFFSAKKICHKLTIATKNLHNFWLYIIVVKYFVGLHLKRH